jgi:hypothetical protein
MRFIFPLFLFLAGCQHMGLSEVELGNDRYAVAYVGGWTTQIKKAMENVADRSHDLCDEKGKDAEVLGLSPGAVGNFWWGGVTVASGTVQCKARATK